MPIFLLAGLDDDVVPPEQALATANLVGTPPDLIAALSEPCNHLGLFMFNADWSVPAFDPKLAQDLLKQANYKGDPIPYRLLNNYYTNQVATAQVLVEMWKSVGLNVQIETKENWSQIMVEWAGSRWVLGA